MAQSIEYESFRTKREAVAWMKECERTKPGDRRIVPMSEVPDDRCISGRAKGHRWAMRWVWTGDRLSIPALRI